MSSPEALLSACTTNHEAQLRLTESVSGTLSLWENWLKPIRPGEETGDDPACDDDFQLMREEINKLSGTDPARKAWRKGYCCWSRCCPAMADTVIRCARMPGKPRWSGSTVQKYLIRSRAGRKSIGMMPA